MDGLVFKILGREGVVGVIQVIMFFLLTGGGVDENISVIFRMRKDVILRAVMARHLNTSIEVGNKHIKNCRQKFAKCR